MFLTSFLKLNGETWGYWCLFVCFYFSLQSVKKSWTVVIQRHLLCHFKVESLCQVLKHLLYVNNVLIHLKTKILHYSVNVYQRPLKLHYDLEWEAIRFHIKILTTLAFVKSLLKCFLKFNSDTFKIIVFLSEKKKKKSNLSSVYSTVAI